MLQRRVATLKEVREALSPADGKKVLDLTPYMNPGCFKVEETTLLARCYVLFRSMGLRHLPVVGVDRALRGIITRKNLIFDEDELGHGQAHELPRVETAEFDSPTARGQASPGDTVNSVASETRRDRV